MGRIIKENSFIFILFLFLFSYPTSFIIMYYLPFFQNEKFYSYFTIVLSSLIYFYFFFYIIFKKNLSLKEIITLISFILLLILYYFSLGVYGSNDSYNRNFVALFTGSLPSILCAFIFLNNINRNNYAKKMIIPLTIFSILLSLFVILNSSEITKVKDYEFMGLTYQTISYYLMYSASLYLALILINNVKIKQKVFYYIMMFTEIFMALAVGGRGGFIYILLIFLFVIIINYNKLFKIFIRLIKKPLTWVVLIVFISIIFCVINTSYFKVGFERIIAMFDENVDTSMDTRIDLYALARTKFGEKPIFGYGLGSVFAICNSYTHHIFTDTLVEIGLFGTIIVLVLFVISFYKMVKLVKKDSVFLIFAFYYIMGFSMCLFSGYYLTTTLLVFGAVFFLCYTDKKYMFENMELNYEC